jgi:DNA replication initiation complex subunit (GINS family)
MEEDSITITYETLYEILRAEKTKDELQELDENFYTNVLGYLKEKTKILQDAAMKDNIFATDEMETTRLQIGNIKKIIKEIYDRREKKILDIAINKSRTNSDIIDTSNLLAQEQKFFKTITGLLDLFRQGILHQLLLLKEPSIEIECEKQAEVPSEQKTTTESIAAAEQLPVPLQENKETMQATLALAEEKQTPCAQIGNKRIKITKQTEQFVGKELELYGPFNEGEVTELPGEIADILIGNGKAVEIN